VIREKSGLPKGYKIKRVDAIAISHGHSDHTDDLIPLPPESEPKVVAIYEWPSHFAKKE